MKKWFKVIYICIFLAICSAPLCFMPFVKNDASLEKRELSKLPSYMEKGRLNVDFSTEFEAWMSDRIPFRPQLLTGANMLKGELFHTPTSNVIDGKDGWLFYENESEDYMDTNAMTEAEIHAVAVSLSLMEEAVEKNGGRFVFVPIPNKASVYGEYMPYYYTKADTNNLDRVMEACGREGVSYVDMKTALTEQKEKGLYHKRDSHWNYQGALIGYNAIMDGLGKEHKTYATAGYSIEKNWRGDVDKLLLPAGPYAEGQYIYDIDYDDFMFTKPAGVTDPKAQLENFMSDKEQGDDLFSTKNKEIGDGSSLYMARDSFGRALLPYMIDNYENATFKRTDCPDINSLAEGTDFVYEIVERNLVRLSERAPFMYAPERTGISGGKSASGEGATIFTEVQGYGVSIYGAFPKDAPIDRVYVSLTQDGKSQTYEAFPVFEKELLAKQGVEDAEKGGKGFSALIDKEGLSGTYELTISVGDRTYAGGTIKLK